MLLSKFLEDPEIKTACDKCLAFLTEEQEADGSWFGRWGTNYIYGTWSVLIALECMELPSKDRRIRKAVNWLLSIQRPDGGWGEDNYSYYDRTKAGQANRSTCFQTAWALLALMSAGETHSEEVRRGINFLMQHQNQEDLWRDPEFTAPGFPKVFYLKYHGYDKYFPLWALARYRNEVYPSS
jgi:squalene-hopene/tetraprenyl-beta-curcumene cyclase